ncbi:MAG: ISAs1 family transposase, partial [Treponema sp.]|nr:ISAs1 family transposase [Treponema sp.]
MELSEETVRRMKGSLGEIPDPRRQWGYLRHKLIDLLVIGLCSIITRGEGFDEMEEMGRDREQWFRQFLELPHGIPDEDTFRRIFERLNPGALMKCLQDWQGEMREAGEHKAIPMVSAWVNENNLVLGQLATEEKSNEITAIPKLLDLIDVSGDTITIDAMGRQKEIVKKIRGQKAHYVLGVKENQPLLYQEIREYFEWLDDETTTELHEDVWESGVEKGHGRIEQRRIRTVVDTGFLSGKKEWKDLTTIIECRGTRMVGDKTSVSVRYFISDKDIPAEEFG